MKSLKSLDGSTSCGSGMTQVLPRLQDHGFKTQSCLLWVCRTQTAVLKLVPLCACACALLYNFSLSVSLQHFLFQSGNGRYGQPLRRGRDDKWHDQSRTGGKCIKHDRFPFTILLSGCFCFYDLFLSED